MNNKPNNIQWLIGQLIGLIVSLTILVVTGILAIVIIKFVWQSLAWAFNSGMHAVFIFGLGAFIGWLTTKIPEAKSDTCPICGRELYWNNYDKWQCPSPSCEFKGKK